MVCILPSAVITAAVVVARVYVRSSNGNSNIDRIRCSSASSSINTRARTISGSNGSCSGNSSGGSGSRSGGGSSLGSNGRRCRRSRSCRWGRGISRDSCSCGGGCSCGLLMVCLAVCLSQVWLSALLGMLFSLKQFAYMNASGFLHVAIQMDMFIGHCGARRVCFVEFCQVCVSWRL